MTPISWLTPSGQVSNTSQRSSGDHFGRRHRLGRQRPCGTEAHGAGLHDHRTAAPPAAGCRRSCVRRRSSSRRGTSRGAISEFSPRENDSASPPNSGRIHSSSWSRRAPRRTSAAYRSAPRPAGDRGPSLSVSCSTSVPSGLIRYRCGTLALSRRLAKAMRLPSGDQAGSKSPPGSGRAAMSARRRRPGSTTSPRPGSGPDHPGRAR